MGKETIIAAEMTIGKAETTIAKEAEVAPAREAEKETIIAAEMTIGKAAAERLRPLLR